VADLANRTATCLAMLAPTSFAIELAMKRSYRRRPGARAWSSCRSGSARGRWHLEHRAIGDGNRPHAQRTQDKSYPCPRQTRDFSLFGCRRYASTARVERTPLAVTVEERLGACCRVCSSRGTVPRLRAIRLQSSGLSWARMSFVRVLSHPSKRKAQAARRWGLGGSVSEKTAPNPGPSLWQVRLPPISSAAQALP